ncbi:MAG: hypothetical protein KatS3mg057_2104 [Herpetosiphonaceae bacterium]|nr:MAG: hypothetical protein KatS3mg057_2104 [Herpetosiphonaceae bacterium]
MSQEEEQGHAHAGITALDLLELPPILRSIVRLMLRKGEMTLLELHQAAANLAAPDSIDQAEIDKALNTLCQQNWLVRFGEGQNSSYKVNIRKKIGRPGKIWDSLDSF